MSDELEVVPDEVELKRMLIDEHLPATEVSRRLSAKGINMPSYKVLKFKEKLFGQIDREIRQERMMENMLESFDRTKIEFEDSVVRIKKYMVAYEQDGNLEGAMAANRDLMKQIDSALSVLGKLNQQMLSIKARNVNLITSTDFIDAFKKVLTSWFENMEVEFKDGKMIFNKPTPEMIDDFYRWEAETRRKNVKVIDVGPRKD